MSWYTIADITEPATEWTKITITKEDLIGLIEGLEEYWLNPNNAFENIKGLYIDNYTYRGTGTIPPESGIIAYFDDIVINTSTSTCSDACLSASIECNYKNWTPDAFNGGTFIMVSGKANGYSCEILDTHPTYIEVPTTYAPQIALIAATRWGNYENFEDAATIVYENEGYWEEYNGWSNDDVLYIHMTNYNSHSGNISVKIDQGPE